MRVAVLGLGSIGMRHVRNLRTLGVGDIVGMDPNDGRRSRFAEEIGARAVESLEDAIVAAPDLAVVASPNIFHLPQALACARAGIHLLIEKPLGTEPGAVGELQEAIEAGSLYAHVGSNWKFHPAFVTMKRLVDEGRIGRIVGAQVLAGHWLPDWHPWEDYRRGYSARADLGGGAVFDSHELDTLTWLVGPAEALTGFAARTGAIETETEDIAGACLRLATGGIATLQLDYLQREARRRYHLTGTEGTIEWDLQDGAVRIFTVAERETERLARGLDDLNEMYVEQTRHVLAGVREGAAPVTPISQAAEVLLLQTALRETLDDGRHG
jgi:predicted dehydrogenase